ncbi:MAG: xanthine dehydrogenase small subunit [Burkholderiales bacterium PBB4]|nr:MAG: xanthine dehydrogenase small subunit [Burkholderiales bacterium PBB4]
MKTQPLQFLRHGQVVSLPAVDIHRTLLEVLREDLHCTGTKEGCNEGDCGACTVVVGEEVEGKLQTRAVNSCIKLAHSVQGKAVWTVEDIAPTLATACAALPPEGAQSALGRPSGGSLAPLNTASDALSPTLHPAQAAMVKCHGSQCGFCTPGFVMSLFGLYQQHCASGQPITRSTAQHALSGNLCRCTGYRPILDAAQAMMDLPKVPLDDADVLSKLQLLPHTPSAPGANLPYKSPRTLKSLLALRSQHPDAQIVAGCTDVGLWINKMHRQFPAVLDVTQVEELRRVEDYPHHIAIGAAVTLTDAFAALVADRPQLAAFASRFAGLPVRNSGTLGGNVANGSPIGDSMPLLIALGANIVLMALRRGKVVHRELRLEHLYTGYRQNVMAPDEVLAWIKVPKPVPSEWTRVYKISKRFEDDISAVCLAIRLQVQDGVVTCASIGVGGVAATPVRAIRTQAALVGQIWDTQAVRTAADVLRSEFSPISDMRASSAYRSTVLGNLLQRLWLESQGATAVNLESFVLEGDAA